MPLPVAVALGVMIATLPAPQRASALLTLAAVFSDRLYFSLALPHNLAAELASDQIAAAYKAGQWPPSDWATRTLAQARADLVLLRRSICGSALIALALAIGVLVLAAAFGKVHPSLPLDVGKAVSGLGATLAAWGAFLQSSPARPSFRGSLLHETMHVLLVRSLVAGGAVLAALGSMWWQSGLMPRSRAGYLRV